MWWKIDKIPHQSLLNTSEWKELVPQLYEKFPNDGMSLNISVTSPPLIHISDGQMEATIYADVAVDVLDNVQVIPVACVSLVRPTRCHGASKSFTFAFFWCAMQPLIFLSFLKNRKKTNS